jgi:hypothetical protein
MALAISVAGLAAAPMPANIVNSGSTNADGFRIAVDRSGAGEYTVMRRGRRKQPEAPEPIRRTIPDALVHRFYTDLEAAQPLSELPHRGCFKSASFGTTLKIEFGDQESPDLSCPEDQDPRTQALRKDADDIMKLFQTK